MNMRNYKAEAINFCITILASVVTVFCFGAMFVMFN